MLVVSPARASQSARKEEAHQLTTLLELVEQKWGHYQKTKRSTTLDMISVPQTIERIVINEVVYILGSKRKLWFKRTAHGYDCNRFYVSEAIAPDGYRYQLELDRSGCGMFDELQLIRARLLDGARYLGLNAYRPVGAHSHS